MDVRVATTDQQCADQLLTVADVCGRIGVHEQTVRGWIKSGELKAAKFGSRIGYRINRPRLLTSTAAARRDRISARLRETTPRRGFRCGATAHGRKRGMIAPDLTFPGDPV
jgi:excisionase family DNA binding protein